jgi:hypothetical protein
LRVLRLIASSVVAAAAVLPSGASPSNAAPPIGVVTATVPLAGLATDVVTGAGAVWVRVDAGGQPGEGELVQRVDPAANEATARVPVGEGIYLAAGGSDVWAPNTAEGTVARIDVRTNTLLTTIRLRGKDPAALAAGAGSVWVATLGVNGRRRLERIDPMQGAVVATIGQPSADIGSGGVAFGGGAIWVNGTPFVARINPGTNRIQARISGAGVPCGGLAADAAGVWSAPVGFRSTVAGSCESTEGLTTWAHGDPLIRIDPKQNAVVARFVGQFGPYGAVDVAIGAGAVWTTVEHFTDAGVHTQGGFALARVDPRTNRVVGRLPLRAFGRVATGFGSVWVAAGNALYRIRPTSVR